MTKYFLIGLIIPILMLENGFALVKYGDAFVKRGTLTIIRQGKAIKYKKNYKKPVKVLKYDVLRAGRRSYVKLKTVQRTTVFMGSNAVFQVRPWKLKKKKGYLRMLYGKAKFRAAKRKSRKRRFSLKTAMAVIGVKGTEWEQSTASNGMTDTNVTEGIVRVTPPNGQFINLGIGQRAFATTQNSLTPPIQKAGVKPGDQDTDPENLNSSPPTSKDSTKVEGEKVYLDAGKLDPKQLEKSKQETVEVDETLGDVKKKPSTPDPDDEQEGEDEDGQAFDEELKESEEEEEVQTEPGAEFITDDEESEEEDESDSKRPGFDPEKAAEDAAQQNLFQTGTIDVNYEN